jgi:hypothetical protein
MVEFALTLPMLLILLLGVADFGRLFSQGIILEAAARNGAEAAAQEYVQLQRNQPLGALDAGDYAALHAVALETLCEEAEPLPNRAAAGSPPTCAMPYAAVCVHDAAAGDDVGAGGTCGNEAAGAPAECSIMDSAWTAAIEQAYPIDPLDPPPLPYVEVRVCYRFTTLFNLTNLQLPFGWGLSVGDVWLQRDRVFVAGAY